MGPKSTIRLMRTLGPSLASLAQSSWSVISNALVGKDCIRKDLMVSFIRKYQYNFDMALDRMQLQKMCKMEHESFKEYAQRWRDLEAQVAPPMIEREMITMIVDALLTFYYEKMVGYIPLSFANLVFTDERIKVGLRRGKFDYPTLMNRKPEKMKRIRRREVISSITLHKCI